MKNVKFFSFLKPAQLNIHKIVLDVKKRHCYSRICSKGCLQNERDQMHHAVNILKEGFVLKKTLEYDLDFHWN